MKNSKHFVIIFLILAVIMYFNSDPNSFTNDMKSEYFPKAIKGKIYDIMRIKGGSIYLNIHTDSGDDGMSVRNSWTVLNGIKKGFFFKKLPHTNQCYIIKGDSIMYFDCFTFPENDSVKIGEIKRWNPAVTNHWILKSKAE
ncbi:hypothetical protein [Chryseobacterium sp.]|uniref:hypothetical protein n=1 Tax=Chryseobacterium sp. TaxID=1871047 RepID=UPI000EB847ED|nr:hypothetical protein [Chryseobacterium sp.]HCA07652.1 hypothetical protein [Chryseobacterium sp.]